MATEQFKYRLVPQPLLEDSETAQVLIEYYPKFSLDSPTSEPEISEEAQEALVYYTAYLMMKTSNNVNKIQVSQVWLDEYKKIVDDYKKTKRTGRVRKKKLPDCFRI